jgi:hypothetical protein
VRRDLLLLAAPTQVARLVRWLVRRGVPVLVDAGARSRRVRIALAVSEACAVHQALGEYEDGEVTEWTMLDP